MSIFSLCFCFPPSARVLTTKGQIPISELQESHRLIVPLRASNGQIALKETSLLSYIHYDPNVEGEFLALVCDNNSELVISEDHLLFKTLPNGKWVPVRAKNVLEGDALIHYDDKQRGVSYPSVTRIQKKVIKGLFAPLTMEGTLIVDNLLVSCYANINSHEVAHAAYAPLRFWYGNLLRAININKSGRQVSQDKVKINENVRGRGVHKYAMVLIALREALPQRLTPSFIKV